MDYENKRYDSNTGNFLTVDFFKWFCLWKLYNCWVSNNISFFSLLFGLSCLYQYLRGVSDLKRNARAESRCIPVVWILRILRGWGWQVKKRLLVNFMEFLFVDSENYHHHFHSANYLMVVGRVVAKLCPTLVIPWTLAPQAPLSTEEFPVDYCILLII